MAALRLCMDLAPTVPALDDWTREHTALLDSLPDHVFYPTKAYRAVRRAELNRSDR